MAQPVAPAKTTPDLKKDFYKARRPEFPPNDGQGPVSQKQIQDLKAQRTKPAPALKLDPPGMRPAPTNSEARIKYMENRLKQTKGVAKDRFQREAPKRDR